MAMFKAQCPMCNRWVTVKNQNEEHSQYKAMLIEYDNYDKRIVHKCKMISLTATNNKDKTIAIVDKKSQFTRENNV